VHEGDLTSLPQYLISFKITKVVLADVVIISYGKINSVLQGARLQVFVNQVILS
jgi:hypothetical protein